MKSSIIFMVGAMLLAGAAHGQTYACAHRGDNRCAPENTLPAFISAVQKGAPMIELDVQRTRDGHFVIMHDATLDRTTNGTGKVADKTLEEIKRLDAGAWFSPSFAGTPVPTLEETLAVIPKTILCNVHLKGDDVLGEQAARILEKQECLKHCFLACTIEQAQKAKTAVPAVLICNMSRQEGNRTLYIKSTIEAKADFIQLSHKNGTEKLAEEVARLKTAGVKVNWFGASEEEPIRLLARAGVEYILTDHLDICQQVLARENAAANAAR